MYPLIIKKEILLPFAILGFVISIIGSVFKITHSNFLGFSSNLILGIGTAILLFTWFIVVIDAIRNGVKNQLMWMVAFLFFGGLASIIFLIYRDQIIIKK